ncbi:MAG: glycosyltransferase [Nostocaceae cyanobacterium]|nr:glycosyltransferase [Nostocaceae cyanobacterium]
MSNAKLRVLFISHAYVTVVNQGKLEAIAQTGKVEVALLAPSNWKAKEWNRPMPLQTSYANSIKVYPAPVLFSGKVGAHIYTPGKLLEVLKDFQPDIVQVEEEVFSLCALQLAIWSRITGKPLVIFGWENMDRRLPLPRHWVRQFVLGTAKLILPGNRDGAELMRKWGYTGLLEVMPQLGVDTELFSPNLRSAAAKTDTLRIGFLGRLVPEKGIDIIFTAARLLKEQGLKCQIVLCGSGPGEQALRQEAQVQRIEDLILWRGGVSHDKAPVEIANFDVLVLPSRGIATWKEQFGHVLIEAMSMGIPVIGSSSGAIPEVIGREDLVFPEDDAQGLAAILARMIRSPEWREEAGRYGINRVYQNYSHERIAERLIGLWQKLVNHKPSQNPIPVALDDVVSVRE